MLFYSSSEYLNLVPNDVIISLEDWAQVLERDYPIDWAVLLMQQK